MLSLEEISDRLEIQQLLIDYSTAIDQRRFDDRPTIEPAFSCRGRSDPEDLGFLRKALKAMSSEALEAQARACRQIAHCATCEHFVGSGHRTDPGSDVNGHPAPFVSAPFTLTDMDPRADANASGSQRRD